MFLNIVRSPELGHLSYILGDGDMAAVVDPRRDCEVYLDIAYAQGARITHIFETHRNEDYVTGSCELADRTGAAIHHGEGLNFGYGNTVGEGDTFDLGDIRLAILHTPGHTPESISITLADTGFGEEPIGVFTGDALFIGDTGRTDLLPDGPKRAAELLYDSIFGKLLPLGDQVILYPAHGAGSICGSNMASREFSTLGYERQNNPALQVADKQAFIDRKMAEHHYQPPYFRQMEELNQQGQPVLGLLPRPKPFGAGAFARAMEQGMVALDIRTPEALSGAFIPGSYAIPVDMLSGFAGWFLPYDRDIGLVSSGFADLDAAVRQLVRLGYDRVVGYLDEGLHQWEVTGRDYAKVPAITARALADRLRGGEAFTLLDVRSKDELETRRLPNATHIYLGELPGRLDDVPKDRPITTFCGSGKRAIIAAAILKQNGFENVEVCLGSMAACMAVGCPMEG